MTNEIIAILIVISILILFLGSLLLFLFIINRDMFDKKTKLDKPKKVSKKWIIFFSSVEDYNDYADNYGYDLLSKAEFDIAKEKLCRKK